ncbi:MAG: ABC transporter permease, partial [Bdellovibrionota bacterium]
MTKSSGKSLWSDAWRRLKRNRASVVSLWFILFVCAVAILAPWIAPFSFETQNIDRALSYEEAACELHV